MKTESSPKALERVVCVLVIGEEPQYFTFAVIELGFLEVGIESNL